MFESGYQGGDGAGWGGLGGCSDWAEEEEGLRKSCAMPCLILMHCAGFKGVLCHVIEGGGKIVCSEKV